MFSTGENLGESPVLSGTLYFYPEDVRALWALAQSEAHIEWELQTMDYGTTEFGIRDPNGFVLAFAEVNEASPRPSSRTRDPAGRLGRERESSDINPAGATSALNWHGTSPCYGQMMRVALTRLFTMALIWSMTPGLTEFVENVWHLAVSGHSAHAIDAGPDHAPEGDEHGCSGTFHLCTCHHTPPTDLAQGNACDVRQPTVSLMATKSEPPVEPALAGLLRPPRA